MRTSVVIPAYTVIPAKAGIQWIKSRRSLPQHVVSRGRHIFDWTPGQARSDGVASVVIPAYTVIPAKLAPVWC